jgi:hypothetical protein
VKGKAWALALALLLAAKGTGVLPRSRELEQRQLITTLAVDGGEETVVTGLTGVRTTEEEEAEVLTGTGDSLAAACAALRAGSSRRAYLGQTQRLLVGESQDLADLLDYVRSDGELRTDTLLYIVVGNGGTGLAASAEKAAGETGGEDPKGRTVGELLPRLTQGEYALAPALRGDETGLTPAGWAVLGPNGVEGYLEGDAALGAQLLLGLGEGEVVTLSQGAVELEKVRAWAKDGTLSCTLTARVVQGTPTPEELAAWGERVLQAALAPGWDCWGLDRQQGALEPWNWETWKGTSVAALRVNVTGKLVETGERGS